MLWWLVYLLVRIIVKRPSFSNYLTDACKWSVLLIIVIIVIVIVIVIFIVIVIVIIIRVKNYMHEILELRHRDGYLIVHYLPTLQNTFVEKDAMR